MVRAVAEKDKEKTHSGVPCLCLSGAFRPISAECNIKGLRPCST